MRFNRRRETLTLIANQPVLFLRAAHLFSARVRRMMENKRFSNRGPIINVKLLFDKRALSCDFSLKFLSFSLSLSFLNECLFYY